MSKPNDVVKQDPDRLPNELDHFDLTWSVLEGYGSCDGFGGAEYRRVRCEWAQAGRPTPIDTFIRWRANIGPMGDPIDLTDRAAVDLELARRAQGVA